MAPSKKKQKLGHVTEGKDGPIKGRDKEWCPCEEHEGKEDALAIHCEKCDQWWHTDCVGLKGQSDEVIKGLKEWECPQCIMKKISPKEELSVEEAVKEELKKCLPTIVKEVVEQTSKTKEFGKTWADLFKKKTDDFKDGAQRTIEKTMHTAIKSNQSDILLKAKQKQDADNTERERRARNVVISGVKESSCTDPQARYRSDIKKVIHVLDVEEDEIVRCVRAGPPPGKGSNKERTQPRLLIVTVATPELAKTLHNYSYGRRVIVKGGDGKEQHVWVNPDMIKTDRDCAYSARKLRKERMGDKDDQNAKRAVQSKTPGDTDEESDGYF